jgi:hypothetical protein
MDYTIAVKNKDIWEFYDKHKNLNFEEMNLIFIDILTQVLEKTSPSLTTSIASQLMDNMKALQNQVSNVAEMFSKSTTDMNTNFALKFMEFKKEYMEDMRMILSHNATDKVAPIIKEYNDTLLDKTRIMFNDIIPKNQESLTKEIENSLKSLHMNIKQDTFTLTNSTINKETLDQFVNSLEEKFSKTALQSQTIFNSLLTSSENRIETKLTEIKDISTSNVSSQSILQNNVGDILKKMENPSSKGRISENILYNVLMSLYPTAQIDFVSTVKETGDIMMIRKDKPRILFENKNYDKNVTQDEVKKFLRDVELQNCSGIMLAQHYGITNKENFEIEMNNNNVLVYLHKVEYDADKIKAAVDIIDHFKETMDDLGTASGDALSIDKNLLDEINKEFQLFVANKISHVKTIKDYQQKLLTQVEDLKMPNLGQYLSKIYASSSSKNDICEYCNYVAKNSRALMAHYRGCSVKKEHTGKVLHNTMQLNHDM